ncbi:helix-hairpin-helix domain-containing protein [Actinoplanes sp. NPDC051861]|uniref:ComEA family DNA-binding protein n=1 Tax=Actinoplanes sp. NPDC051861 TaxID=3155170 RepID=UPI0034490D98
MTWTPPDKGAQPGPPPFPPPFPGGQSGFQPPAAYTPPPAYATPPGQKPVGPARLSWRIAHSAWLITPIIPFSCLSAAGFLYVGVRMRRVSWCVAGVIYSVIGNVCFFLGSAVPEGSVAQNLIYTFMFLMWPISVVHAFIINNTWLRWRAQHVPWYNQPQPVAFTPPPMPTAAPLPPQLQDVVPPPQEFYTAPPALLDVNMAAEHELAALPGLGPQRAAQVMAARQARGGFLGLPEFAAVAGLAPHEFVAIRDRLSCNPPPPPPDATEPPPPGPPEPPPYGRIVDV